MYKDNGTVDVELLAEVGYIAHSIRNLDKKLSTLAPNPLDANTTNVICPDATGSNQCHHQSALSSKESSEPKPSSKLENIIIDFYEKHQEFHLDKDRAAVEQYFRDKSHSRLYQLTSGQDTMNNSNPNRSSNNVSDTSAFQLIGDEHKDNIESDSNLTPSKSHDATVQCLQRNSVGRGSISQPMPEIQISNSDDTNEATATASLDQQHKEQISPSSSPLKIGGGFGGGSGGTCGHYCSGWQSAICSDQLSDEDLRKLVSELKNKVDFTERMNWLCEYRLVSYLLLHVAPNTYRNQLFDTFHFSLIIFSLKQ